MGRIEEENIPYNPLVFFKVVRRENGTLLAVVVSLFAAVFCGTGPSLKQASDWNVEWIWRMSFNCYAAEAQCKYCLWESVFFFYKLSSFN